MSDSKRVTKRELDDHRARVLDEHRVAMVRVFPDRVPPGAKRGDVLTVRRAR